MPHTHPVLIAEDDEDTIFMLERSLRRAGVQNPVKIVQNGEEALSYLESSTEEKTPRLAVLDVRMPLKDGFEVLKQVRTHPRLSLMPVIIFSSSTAEKDICRAYELGANSYVVKPGDTEGMDAAVKKMNDYWLHTNRSANPG
jgi:DNA-binding response OmpR family regulator